MVTSQTLDGFIQEGKIQILKQHVVGKVDPTAGPSKKRAHPDSGRKASNDDVGSNTLFYNPAQVFNRDISLVVLKCFGERRVADAISKFDGAQRKLHVNEEIKGLTICEPLAATGLRSLRYATELPRSIFRSVTTSDVDAFAVEQAKANRAHNNVSEEKMKCVHAEANELLHCGRYICNQANWDVVDIDPYGTAAPFVEAAISAVRDGGLVCITSTDMPVLGGNSPDVAFYKYGGCTVKARYLHEMALRLVVHQLQMTAAKHRRYVTPLLSLSVDFYVRVFAQVWDKPVRCSDLCLFTAIVYQCATCDFFVTAPFGLENDRPPNPEGRKKRRRTEKRGSDAAVKTEETQEKDAEGKEGDEKDDEGIEATEATSTNDRPRCTTYTGVRTSQRRPVLGRVPRELTGNKCPECGGTLVIGGPFYAGPLHDDAFVKSCLEEMERSKRPAIVMLEEPGDLLTEAVDAQIQAGSLGSKDKMQEAVDPAVTAAELAWVQKAKARYEYEMASFKFEALSPAVHDKIVGVLTACTQELPDVPFFYNLSSICNHARVCMIKLDKFKSALRHLGYEVGLFHREPLSIKTDAPVTVIYDLMRGWVQSGNKGEGAKTARTPPNYLQSMKLLAPGDVDFSPHVSVIKARKDQRPRWVPNPSSHWGPGRRAGPSNLAGNNRSAPTAIRTMTDD
eukprot:Blabericola_migrator_1__4106@NODE_224_length_11141_cov_42_071880_g190_i0_p1_GENE_NODE_224_length_11141_cov_42_071880_g190_i0NODE_224_length_11141_cov_42_071880_g190_i0_p1_ORF_typecomplete_len678_score99_15TRM/PF02005_16/1_6e95TRM/PF02005_16/4_5e18Methyltrans_SAM/PF10672_9/0_00045MTS/PF05175_14/0_0023Methyltransf_31/PF13847_6/0_021PrmA/PF06325_13/0_028Cons_hypoth95/PF03602_15/0_041DUF2067/PF09840_9/0_1zfC4_Topoisom/PF01396_19/0_25_NODE_224_length_11141_cov_42_071880_g190_i061238156